jgi:hypothetical protein
MNRLDDELKNGESRNERQEEPQESRTPKAQPLEVPLRRPLNFDDWDTNPREDDPTR